MPRGGARPGTGPKKIYGETMSQISVTLPAFAIVKLSEKAQAEKKTVSMVIRDHLPADYFKTAEPQ